MRILSVGPAPPWRGGIAQYHWALAGALEEGGHQVRVINFRHLYPDRLFPGTDPLDVGAGALPPLGEQILDPVRPWTWARAGRAVREMSPETVLFHWWHPFFAPVYLGVMNRVPAGVPRGAIVHNVSPHEQMPGGRFLGLRFLRRCDFLLTGGTAMAEVLRRYNPRARVAMVPHPPYVRPHTRDLPDRAEARRRLELPAEGTLFLFFGLVRPYKGLDVLLDALAMLPLDLPWSCVVAGEFYEPAEPFRRHLAEHRLDKRVRLVDRYIPNAEVPDYFAAADLVVLPYRRATQSGVAALARALRRPVLSTRTGAIAEAVREGVDGWLVEPGDAVALAARMQLVVLDPAVARLPVCTEGEGGAGWQGLAAEVVRLARGQPPTASGEEPR
jgi:D-inositol-3-phosphate glycosyltransferase